MQYTYRGLRSSQISSIFPGCLPCKCYDDDSKTYKIPRYDVNISYAGVELRGTRLIKEISVECDCCGARERYDVERRDVFGYQLPW